MQGQRPLDELLRLTTSPHQGPTTSPTSACRASITQRVVFEPQFFPCPRQYSRKGAQHSSGEAPFRILSPGTPGVSPALQTDLHWVAQPVPIGSKYTIAQTSGESAAPAAPRKHRPPSAVSSTLGTLLIKSQGAEGQELQWCCHVPRPAMLDVHEQAAQEPIAKQDPGHKKTGFAGEDAHLQQTNSPKTPTSMRESQSIAARPYTSFVEAQT